MTVGCCCQMIGFAVTSFKDNGVGGLFAQGVGTSMLQIPNIMRRPLIWLPPTLASAILGPIAIIGPFHMTNNATGSGMGTSGLVHDLPDHDSDRGACAGYFENHSISFPASRSAVLCDLSRNAQHGIYQGRPDEAGCVKRRELSLRSKCIFWHHKACCRAKWTVICL